MILSECSCCKKAWCFCCKKAECSYCCERHGAPVRRLGAQAVRKLSECSCCEKAWLVIARDGVGGRALNGEIVVIINDDKFIFIIVCCQMVVER